jgi:hypothetical protein
MMFDCYHEASKVGVLPEFRRLVHLFLPIASQRGAHILVPTFTINHKEIFGLAKNAKGVVGVCGGVHGRSQGVIVLLQGMSTHERRRYLLRRLQQASGTYFVKSLKDMNSNMDRYFNNESICGIEGTSAPNVDA